MRICSAKTKGTDRSASGNASLRFPVLDCGVHIKGRSCKIKMRIWLLKMQAWHQFFLSHLQQDFLQTRETSRHQGMTNIRFDRTDGTILFALGALLKYRR